MIVRPVVMQQAVQNSQNVTGIKQNQDARPAIEQANISVTTQKEVQQKAENVLRKNDADGKDDKYDAKEKGSNEYYTVKVKKKKIANSDEGESEEKVLLKSSGMFDMKI